MGPATDRLHENYTARHTLPADLSKSVGCITPAAPIELILAAGLTPVRLHGNPARLPEMGDTYMEEEIDGEVRSLFDTFLRGEYAQLPLVLMSRGSEQYLQLYYYLGEVVKWGDYALPPIKIVDVMQTSNWNTGRYVRARLLETGTLLSDLGTKITPETLRAAIKETNAMRRALKEMNTLRRDGLFRGSDILRMTTLFGTLPSNEFLTLASDLIAEVGAQDPKGSTNGPRIMLSGTAQDDPGLYEDLETAGALVVADDHVAGERVFEHLIAEDCDPWDAISEHYQLFAPGLRQHPQKRQDERFLATCKAAAIDGDLCVLEDCDDTLGWDWPSRRQALNAMNVPSVLLTGENYFRPDINARKTAIEALLKQVSEGIQ